MSKELFIGNSPVKLQESQAEGKYVTIEDEVFYKIAHYDLMRPFFISLVSHSDHWLFISTTGGLSAGRKNENSALFPYYTEDKISESFDTTGSKTLLRIHSDKVYLWEPFSERYRGIYSVSRNLYKNFTGNKIIFEEKNHDLNLTFSYSWQFSEKYGIVKKSSLVNTGNENVQIEILDGIQNILPYGVNADLQNRTSNLANAYKKNELEETSGMGMFMLSAIIVDKAEPSEALKTTTAWHIGFKPETILLSSLQVNKFRQGLPLETEVDIKAERGAYFINGSLTLGNQETSTWYMVAEVNQDHVNVLELINQLSHHQDKLKGQLLEDIEDGTKSLKSLVAKADGLQLTEDRLSVGRHYSNVLFNVMRGGIFEDQYVVEKNDLINYFGLINKNILAKNSDFLNQFKSTFGYQELLHAAVQTKDVDVIRICYEYLPLSFSRRHGDPSRPWNKFSIDMKKEDGSVNRNYQGNWRDIFQNWEALSLAFPEFIYSMISKFVNASTIDGYNPYRITREGIDWEVIEPDDPWSYIGYWGDHQIIYLLKLLEIAKNHNAEKLNELLSSSIFVYANVPYRIKPYDQILKNPKDTIDFDDEAEKIIEERALNLGGDGKLNMSESGELHRANLIEKILVMLLAKLSNFIPEGGIWLNTQRPEWNDANNALVGNGVSMVTLYYMRRFVTFFKDLLSNSGTSDFTVNEHVVELYQGIFDVFQTNKGLLEGAFSDSDRRKFVDSLGRFGEAYRTQVYSVDKGNTGNVSTGHLLEFVALTIDYFDHTIKANKRDDGLYHAYNLIAFNEDKASIDYLYEMLEGQVAVLSAGTLNLEEALEVLDALKNSAIYRADQYSYMLYPNRSLPRFLEKNLIPREFCEKSKLVKAMVKDGNTSVIQKDTIGDYHFNGSFNNVNSLIESLNNLKDSPYNELIQEEYNDFLEVFEEMFNHKAFTGRSGTFYGYEGLGSIYWHMVSKLLLATQENIYWGWDAYQGSITMGKMMDHYYEIRAGIGINKSPDLYGAFPTDPYSHTPATKGAQQPGMTGQVKEDVINRWAELGVQVHNGCLTFEPHFLHAEEFLKESSIFEFVDVNNQSQEIKIQERSLAFTYCQVPIVYSQAQTSSISIEFNDGKSIEIIGNSLDKGNSSKVFNRTGQINRITLKTTFHTI